jgi:maltooligosyltrehalose trehalohydrolase
MKRRHAMPFGATVEAGGVRFRLWAPAARSVALRLEGARDIPMNRSADGWFELASTAARAGSRYRYVIDSDAVVPDPASRYQPDSVHGPSVVIDPAAFAWTDESWRGRPWHEAVVYELHVGTFTPAGTYDGAIERLDHLIELGVTAIELMPLSECPGAYNWGYDGVYHFAPESRYGTPDGLKRLICAAHARNLMVLVDVVYNHFGPEGNYLGRYAPQFFTDRYTTPWGSAINFDGDHSRAVRDFFIHNALYWVQEFHIDGLRFDAVHAIYDQSPRHILFEISDEIAHVAHDRPVHLVLENDDNDPRFLDRYAAQWNDDIHHALHVTLTGETDGYYVDYADDPVRHLGRCLAEGFAYQGEFSQHRNRNRGAPSLIFKSTSFVSFLQNHDQVGNRAGGERIAALTAPPALRAALAIYLLAPSPPLMFMGEEGGSTQPFYFFCDFEPELAKAVREGRKREFEQFKGFSGVEIPDPTARETFLASVLRWDDMDRKWLAYCRELLAVRRSMIVPRSDGAKGLDYRTNGRRLQARWRMADGKILALVADLADKTMPLSDAQPFFATPGESWRVAWYLEP